MPQSPMLGFLNHLLLLQANQCQDFGLLQPMCHKIRDCLLEHPVECRFPRPASKDLVPLNKR